MRLLIDTHVVFWCLLDAPKLPANVRTILQDPSNCVFVSAASGFEIAYKVRRGRWPEAAGLSERFEAAIAEPGFTGLPITLAHAVRAGAHGTDHKDPFDRLILAQAEVERMTLVSADPSMHVEGLAVLWSTPHA